MSAKKLIPSVGFSNKKNIEKITVQDTEVDSVKHVIRETIQGTNEEGILDPPQDTILNIVHDTINNINNDRVLNSTLYSTLGIDLDIPLDSNYGITKNEQHIDNDTTQDIPDDNELVTPLDSVQDSVLSNALETPIDTIYNSKQSNIIDSEQSSNKMTYQIPIKHESFSKRLVANVTPSQKIFVQEISKKFENESSFVRFMISSFMKDIDFKENKAGK